MERETVLQSIMAEGVGEIFVCFVYFIVKRKGCKGI